MRIQYSILSALLLTLACPVFAAPPDDKLKAEEVLAKHLDSIGKADARAAAKSRMATGATKLRIIAGGTGEMIGGATVLSDGNKLQIHLPFKYPTYVGEFYEFDGKRFSDSQINPQTRSRMGAFVSAQSKIMEEGLLGGTLTTAWALLDVAGRQAKLDYNGLKKVGGRSLHQVTYRMKKGGDVSIQLFFEPETFRHVMTVYQLSQRAAQGPSEVESARQQETRYRLEENFSEFTTVDGLTLPGRWKIQFTSEFMSQGVPQSSILEWDIVLQKFTNNTPVATAAFNAH